MLTIFTVPKPFRGDIATIQTNAIRSWVRLQPECQVILFGNEEGTAGIARALGVQHIARVECNEFGTPLLHSLFHPAREAARRETMCFVNTDIILMNDFMEAVRKIPPARFLMIGLRWDLDVKEPINFDDERWEPRLRAYADANGKQHHGGGGGDYFVYPRGLFDDIPAFAIGRGGWDNWLIYRARSLRVPVFDATGAVKAIHQNHGYSHIKFGDGNLYHGLEGRRNGELMGGAGRNAFTVEYATVLITPQGLKRAWTRRHIYFKMRALPVLHPRFSFLLRLFKGFETALGWMKRLAKP